MVGGRVIENLLKLGHKADYHFWMTRVLEAIAVPYLDINWNLFPDASKNFLLLDLSV